jgi:hypothetical protein
MRRIAPLRTHNAGIRFDAPPRQPSASITGVNADADLVAEFIAGHGVRRFERGASGEMFHIKQMLAARGFELTLSNRGNRCTLRKGKAAPKHMSLDELQSFVDDLRVAEGLEPMVRRA